MAEDVPKFEKVHVLLRLQRMFLKKGNDEVPEMLQAPNAIRHAFTVIGSDYSASEKSFQSEEDPDIPPMLNDGKFRKHLVLGTHFWVRIDADVKATFAVNKSNHPIGI
jgi:hypothetical protein